MIPWWGLIPAVMAGTLIGFWIAALVSANERDNNNDRHEK